jgi:hypothetical protein
MFCLEVIKSLREQSARRAIGKQPFIAAMDADPNVAKMPNFGDYRAKGWRLKQKFFVNSSVFESDNGPALSAPQFIRKVKAGMGYAIIEEGQFQMYVGEFKRVAQRSKKQCLP